MVRLKPSTEVANILKKWFGSVRYTYNWALSCIKNKPDCYKKNMYWLRKKFINACNIPNKSKWLLETPKSVRDGALHDLDQAYKTNFAKKDHKFSISFRKKKDNQSIVISYDQIKTWKKDNTSIGEMGMFPTFVKNKILFHCKKNNLPDNIEYDCRLSLNKLGQFHLHIPIAKVCENQTDQDNWCSIDPGVKIPWTVYSPTPGICYKIGENDISRIFRLCRHLDKLISKTTATGKHKGKKRSRRQMKIAQTRLRTRIKCLVDEVQWKAINFILSQFKNVIIPPFQTSQMVKKLDRKITSQSVRKMICWKHFTFRQRLLYKAELCNANVFVRTEQYTSKACTNCFNIKYNLGGSRTYKCTKCHIISNRDVCGARNIFLKNALGSNF